MIDMSECWMQAYPFVSSEKGLAGNDWADW
jgi:enolase